MNIENCEVCLNSRLIISENGYHSICCLSDKKAMDCMSGKKNYFVTLKKDSNYKYNPDDDCGRVEYEITF